MKSAGPVCLLILATAAGPGLLAAQIATSDGAYRVGPKDLIEVRVFEEDSFNVSGRVSEQGTIRLPLLGEIEVEGLTDTEIAAILKVALEKYLQRATVTVEVREFRSKPISVIGAVNRPGTLELSARWTLFEALTEAGGLTDQRGEVVYVLRHASNGLFDQLEIRIEDLLVRGDQHVNIPIFANDVIHVPPAREVSVFFMGEVERPGAVTFKSTDRISLVTAIARAGGLTERAAHRIVVKRTDDSGMLRELVAHFKRIMAGEEPDLLLQPGDVVVVKESFF